MSEPQTPAEHIAAARDLIAVLSAICNGDREAAIWMVDHQVNQYQLLRKALDFGAQQLAVTKSDPIAYLRTEMTRLNQLEADEE